MTATTCSLCGSPTTPVLRWEGEAALSNRLWEDESSARRAPAGVIELAFCSGCGAGRNLGFDPGLARYDDGYGNSLHGSTTFSRYAVELAEDLVCRHDLYGRRLLEIGAGGGEFLRLLCDRAGAGTTAIAVDPSYREPALDEQIRWVPALDDTVGPVEFLCARHVLEHVEDPVGLLSAARQVTPADQPMTTYLEVPDAAHMVRTTAVWDVIHEHVWYFSDASLRLALAAAGFEVLRTGTSYGGQYLWAEAVSPAGGAVGGHDHGATPLHHGLSVDDAVAFGARADGLVRWWQRELARRSERGEVIVLWGAGSKGVAFLARVPGSEVVRKVVDVNPSKHGRHLPGSGRVVSAPADLRWTPPDTVLVMNELYRAEVAAELARLQLEAELLVVGDLAAAQLS